MSTKAGLLGVSVVEDDRGRPACIKASWVLRRWIWGLPFWGGSPPPPVLLRRLCRLVPRFIMGGAPRICCSTRLRAAGGVEVGGWSESGGVMLGVEASPNSDPASAASGAGLAEEEERSCGTTDERRRWGWKSCFRPWPSAPMFSKAF